MSSTDPSIVASIPCPRPDHADLVQISTEVSMIARFPERLRRFLAKVPVEDLRATYRPGGWNVARIVHHLADSHLHAYARTKFALVEDTPAIKPYDENTWVETAECTLEDVHLAVDLLAALHARWARLLSTLDDSSWNRAFHHPERGTDIRLYQHLANCAWHGEHHLAQVAIALRRELPI